MRKHLSHRLRELLIAATSFLASASTALAQELVTPAEVVLYIQSEMKSTDFVQPLVCALQRVLTAPVLTKTLDLRLGPGLRATPTQFDVGKVADLFIQTTAADGGARSFKYLLIPYDLKAKPWNYVFATSFANESTPYHVGVLSTARLDVGNPMQQHRDGSEITAMRAYKLILKSIARVAGLKSPDACVLAFPRSLDDLDRKSSEFCPDDHASLVKAGILKSKQNQGDQEVTDCLVISQREASELQIATAR